MNGGACASIFGPWGSESRRSRDPLTLVQTADPTKAPYIYLTAGQNEPLLKPDRAFAERLSALHFQHEFRTQARRPRLERMEQSDFRDVSKACPSTSKSNPGNETRSGATP